MEGVFSASELLNEFKFDWYEGSFLAPSTGKAQTTSVEEEDEATIALMSFPGAHGLSPRTYSGAGALGYGSSVDFLLDASCVDPVCRVSFASMRGAMPHLTIFGAQGAGHNAAVEFQKHNYPFSCSRADCRLDVIVPGGWDVLHEIACKMLDGNNKIGSPETIHGSGGGRTFYVGAPKSACRLRVYEKDKELCSKGIIPAEDVDPDRVRIEFQFRPATKHNIQYARLTPGQMVSSTPMSRKFIHAFSDYLQHEDTEVEILKVPEIHHKKTVFDVMKWGFRQYKNAYAKAALASLLTKREQDGLEGRPVAPILVEDINVEAVSLFEDEFRGSDAAHKALADSGLIGGELLSPRDRAIQLMQTSKERREIELIEILDGHLKAIDYYKKAGFSDEFIAGMKARIEKDRQNIDANCWEGILERVKKTDLEVGVRLIRDGVDALLANYGICPPTIRQMSKDGQVSFLNRMGEIPDHIDEAA